MRDRERPGPSENQAKETIVTPKFSYSSTFFLFLSFTTSVRVSVCVCAVYACRCLYFKMKPNKSSD